MGPACGPSRASRRLDAPAPRGPERGPERGGVSMTTGLTPDSPNTRAVLGPTKDLRAGSAPVPAPGHGTSNHANSRGRGDHRGRSGGGRTMRDSRAQERLKSRRAILESSRFPSPALVVGLQQASKPTVGHQIAPRRWKADGDSDSRRSLHEHRAIVRLIYSGAESAQGWQIRRG